MCLEAGGEAGEELSWALSYAVLPGSCRWWLRRNRIEAPAWGPNAASTWILSLLPASVGHVTAASLWLPMGPHTLQSAHW